MRKSPFKVSWRFERLAQSDGRQCVAGIDEAGRGPLAGPVVAAVVVFAPGVRVNGLADSKCLTPDERERLAVRIRQKALACAVAAATAAEIDRINVYQATLLAARRAVEALPLAPDYFITDYIPLPWIGAPVERLVHGDARCASVAAASILAKVARDAMMRAYDAEYPGYGFAGHKGYTCRAHLEALGRLGPTTLHRMTFNGVTWFDIEPRASQTFQELTRLLNSMSVPAADADGRDPSGADALASVRRRLEALDPPLVERERAQLDSLCRACEDRLRAAPLAASPPCSSPTATLANELRANELKTSEQVL
jgi:ribonuclease HII